MAWNYYSTLIVWNYFRHLQAQQLATAGRIADSRALQISAKLDDMKSVLRTDSFPYCG